MKTRKYDIYTFTAAANNTIEALAKAKASVSGNVSIARAKHDGVVLYCRIKFADGHKKMVTGMGKTIKSAEHNLLCNIIKRIVPADEYANAVKKLLGKTDVHIEAKTNIQVEAKAEVVVEKQTPAVLAPEIPRLETVRNSRSPKKLKAQKLAESTETTSIVEIGTTNKQIEKAAGQVITLPTREVNNDTSRLYSVTKSSFQQVGGKFFVNVPVELLFADYRYQRLTHQSNTKIRNLVDKWNPAKMDALRVSFHDDENKIAVINGMHRLIAAKLKGMDMIECEVITDLPQEPVERLKAEAKIFVSQNDEIDLLKPHHKHNAGIILGIPEYIALDKVMNKYGIELKKATGKGGRVKAGELAGYVEALRTAKNYGEEHLDYIFNIICESRWNLSRYGLSNAVIRTLTNVIKLHPGYTEEIIKKSIEFMKPITPIQFIAESVVAYPKRREIEQATLYLEDYLCDAIGMDRVYLADKGIERHSTINAEVPVGVSAS